MAASTISMIDFSLWLSCIYIHISLNLLSTKKRYFDFLKFGMFLLFVVLFIPMQWGAPGGQVRIYHAVVPIVPNVGGMITEVPAKTLTPMKRGDVLFQIDERGARCTC